jgi:endothelin-converting enzyme/putative endopeptidase
MRRYLAAAGLIGCILMSGGIAAATDRAPLWVGTRSGIDLSSMDPKVVPGDDFSGHATGRWLPNGIPKGRWDYGSFSLAADRTEAQIKQLFADAIRTRAAPGTPQRLVADAYRAALDTDGIDARGSAGIERETRRILASRAREQVARAMATPGSSTIVAINVIPSDGEMLVHLDQQNQAQPMLGLGGRDDYERQDGAFPAKRRAYRDHVARLLALAGVADASARADQVLALETRIAADQWDLNRLRDRRANHHPIRASELPGYAPGFPWAAFLQARGVGDQERLVLGTDTALQAQARLFAATPVEHWNSYLAYHWIQNRVDFLPKPFREAEWAYRKPPGEAGEPPARAEMAVRFVNTALRDQVGRLYVERHFPPRARAAAVEMTEYIRRAFRPRIERASCLDGPTRAEALAKLTAMRLKVGHPTAWPSDAGLVIRPDDAAGNLRRIHEAEWRRQLKALEPGYKSEGWWQSPQTVDASYSVLLNAIELPAAILQPPFFDAGADPAAAFGAIGSIIGHEMSHGFDDQGILFDAKGGMRDWWSPAALQCFRQRGEALVEQYGQFSPLPGLKIDGRQTIGENVADGTGLSVAYDAYRLFLADHPELAGRRLDGFTDDQRFFLAFGQVWSHRAPEDAIRSIVAHSYHPPAKYRANGAVRNVDAWYRAFGIKPEHKLFLPQDKRVAVW